MKNIFTIIFLFLYFQSSAQILNQDQSGNSSIIVSGGSIGIDIKETQLKANYYSPTDSNNGFMWGIDLQGKNSTGISTLFSKEKFTPETKLSFLVGYHFASTNYKGDFKKKEQLQLQNRIKYLEKSEKKAIEKNDRIKYISESVETLKKLGAVEIAGKLQAIIQKTSYKNYQKGISNLIFQLKKEEKNNATINHLKELSIKVSEDQDLNNYIKIDKELDAERNKLKKYESDNYLGSSKHRIYLRPIINALEFKYDNQNMAPVFSDRFLDTLQVHGALELGFTSRINTSYLGASIKYGGVSSFSTLTKATYSFTTIDSTVTGGTLTKTSEVSAFSGNYFNEKLTTFRVDWLKLVSYNQKESKFLALGFYFSRNWFSNSNEFDQLENRSALGTFINLIDGKKGSFLGGIYLQSNDIFNETKNGFEESINFGITTKYIINTPVTKIEKTKI